MSEKYEFNYVNMKLKLIYADLLNVLQSIAIIHIIKKLHK